MLLSDIMLRWLAIFREYAAINKYTIFLLTNSKMPKIQIQRMSRNHRSARNNWVNALLSFIKNWERFCVYSCHKGGTIVHSSSNWELWWSSLVNTENIGSPFVGVVLHIFCALLSNIYQVTVYTHHYLHESFRTKTS